jgi:DNA transformation protein
MAVSQGYLDYILDQLHVIGPVRAKRMFGGVGLYREGVFFGLIAGDVLYFKVDDSNKPDYAAAGMEPFRPYGKGSYAMSYFAVPEVVLEDEDLLRSWARKALEASLRKPSTKKRKKG